MTTSRGVARLCLQGARSLSTTNATTKGIRRGFAARAVAASATATNNNTAAAAAAAASSNIVGDASSSSVSTSSTIHAAREGFALRGSVGWAASRLHRHHHQLGVPHHQRRHLHRIVSTVSSRGLVGSSFASSTSRVCDWLHQPGGGGTAAASRNPSGASRGEWGSTSHLSPHPKSSHRPPGAAPGGAFSPL